jgi:GH25 family lysozyme M1 (1,4-beta-N-acetylmuramidase)
MPALTVRHEASQELVVDERKMKLFGPDVSHFQSEVDCTKVAAHGESFGGVQGHRRVESNRPAVCSQLGAMKKAGIDVRIAYHYGHAESSAIGQADHFLNTVRPVAAGDVLCLDAEDVCEASKKVSTRNTATWVAEFLDRVVNVSGRSSHR